MSYGSTGNLQSLLWKGNFFVLDTDFLNQIQEAHSQSSCIMGATTSQLDATEKTDK